MKAPKLNYIVSFRSNPSQIAAVMSKRWTKTSWSWPS